MKTIFIVAASFVLATTAMAAPFDETIKKFDDSARSMREVAKSWDDAGNHEKAAYYRRIAEDYSELAATGRLAKTTGNINLLCSDVPQMREIAQFFDEVADSPGSLRLTPEQQAEAAAESRQSAENMRNFIVMCGAQ